MSEETIGHGASDDARLRLLRLRETARLLGVDESEVRRWIDLGYIAVVWVGKNKEEARIPRHSLEVFLQRVAELAATPNLAVKIGAGADAKRFRKGAA